MARRLPILGASKTIVSDTMSDDNLAAKVGGFAADATVDTFADNAINGVLDGVASHLPGGGAIEGVLKTGVDLAANNAINAELGSIFGGHAPEPPAQS
jgi:hypothetical protein